MVMLEEKKLKRKERRLKKEAREKRFRDYTRKDLIDEQKYLRSCLRRLSEDSDDPIASHLNGLRLFDKVVGNVLVDYAEENKLSDEILQFILDCCSEEEAYLAELIDKLILVNQELQKLDYEEKKYQKRLQRRAQREDF